MKKSLFTIVILFSLFSLGLSSCDNKESDDPTTPGIEGDASGTYKVILDDNVVIEGTATKIIFYAGELQLQNSDADLTITLNHIPDPIGGANSFSEGGLEASQFIVSGPNLLGSGEDETYYAFTGAVTRTSATKISFEGTCGASPSAEQHTFSGSLESDAYIVE